jgi:hypothetical protein
MPPKRNSANKAAQRVRTGAGATGVGAGTLLVLLARNLPDTSPWKSWALILAPSVSVALSWLVIWLRTEIEYILNTRNQRRIFDAITVRIEEALKNPLTSDDHKMELRKKLEEVEKLSIEVQREQLQLVLRDVK